MKTKQNKPEISEMSAEDQALANALSSFVIATIISL